MSISRVITIPDESTRDWIVSQKGEMLGDLLMTKNIDLESNKGKVRLAERVFMYNENSTLTNLSTGNHFVQFLRSNADGTDRYWALINGTPSGGGSILAKSTNSSPISAYAQDAISNTPTTSSSSLESMENFPKYNGASGDVLMVTHSDDIAKISGGTWTASWWKTTLGQSALNSSYPRVLRKFNVNNFLVIGNENNVHTVDNSAVVNYQRLIFPSGYIVNCIVATPDYVWFFLSNLKGGDAIASRWDGAEESFETPIPLYDPIVHSAVIHNGIPYCVNGKGQLLGYNGQAFAQVAVLPVYYDKRRWGDSTVVPTSSTVLHRNGMAIIDGEIHMLIRSTISGFDNIGLETMPAGIWALSKDNGLYCKYSLGQYAPDLSSAITNEYGSRVLSAVGGLLETTIDVGHFLAGAECYKANVTTLDQAIYASKANSSTSQRGHFLTRQFHIGALASAYVHEVVRRILWEHLGISTEQFVDSTNRIVVKMRTQKISGRTFTLLQPCTWTSTTTFTTTSSAPANAVVGDEVEVACGLGAGATAHITVISLNAGTYTITLDEAIGASSGTFMAYLNNFVKIGDLSSLTLQDNFVRLARKSSWIQFKVELRGSNTSPEIKDMSVAYQTMKI